VTKGASINTVLSVPVSPSSRAVMGSQGGVAKKIFGNALAIEVNLSLL
jgi:hypothetical protein